MYLVFRCRRNLIKNKTNTRNVNFKQDRQCTYKVTLRRLSCNHFCSRKPICITYCECVFVALRIQHAMRMCHIVFCGLPGSTLFFYIILQTTRFSKKNKLLSIKCVSWFSLQRLSETFLILRKYEQDMMKNVHLSSCKVRIYLVRFQWILNFLDRFSNNIPISNIMRIRPV